MAAEAIKKRAPVFVKVASLRPDTTGHNLKVKVVDAKVVLKRPGSQLLGNPANRVAECTVGDETGVIVLTARNEQVDVAQPGSSIVIRNAKIDMFRGSMRLAVNQWGKLEAAAEALDAEPLTENNLSLIEFELVPIANQESGAAAAAAGASEAGGAEAGASGSTPATEDSVAAS